jgi:hypothetical protein
MSATAGVYTEVPNVLDIVSEDRTAGINFSYTANPKRPGAVA